MLHIALGYNEPINKPKNVQNDIMVDNKVPSFSNN